LNPTPEQFSITTLYMKQLLSLLLVCLGTAVLAQADRSEAQSYPPKVSQGQLLGEVPALRDLQPVTTFNGQAPSGLYEKKNYFKRNPQHNPAAEPAQGGDPLVSKQLPAADGGGPEIIQGLSIEGLRDPFGVYPPDPTGDIGKDHYVQMVNSGGGAWFQVWDKITGEPVYGPALTATIWGSFGLPTLGDPIISYDHAAERWIMMEIQANGSNPFADKQLFLGVSETSDPTGGWKVYLLQTLGFPDYPKLFVWKNAYFITVNEIVNSNVCAGYAIDRTAILNNEPTFGIYRFEMPNYQSINFQPATGADWDSGPAPPAGSPGYMFRVYDDAWEGGVDQIQYWEVFLDWANSANSHIDGPVKLYPAPFETRVCYGSSLFDCIEQPGNAPRVTAFENNFMYRAPYQNFGTHEAVVMNHVTDVSGQTGDGGDAQVRWYELRKSGSGDWQIYQQGTHAPTQEMNRITGTICMDEAGNIGLGYTGMSETVYPGLYLSGHRNGDPAGQMTVEEFEMAPGGASHQSFRWGDYSNMAVDPYDGRTFWFTGEYQPDNQATWGTRIASFKVQRDTFDIKPELITAPAPSAFLGASEQVTVKISNNGLLPASQFDVSLYFEGAFVATETVTGTLDAGSFITHTFTPTVAMTVPGKNYNFKIITHWSPDQFVRNDTLVATIQKLTGNDAALPGKYNLPGLVCGTETDFAIILKNASGADMHSARINWRINSQAWKVYDWTGNLGPGERDTIELYATGILNGLNGLRAYTTLPNGVQDERINNDTLFVKFFGNSDGTYLSAESQTDVGVLHWELRTLTNQLLSMGDVSAQQPSARICADDNQCYKLLLRAVNFNWKGHFVLRNIYDEVMVEINEATGQDQVFTICSPVRKNSDVGALGLVSPVTGAGLTANEPVSVRFRNFGLNQQNSATVSYRISGGNWVSETVPGPFAPGQTAIHTFAAGADLGFVGAVYPFELKATVGNDENTSNDTTSAIVRNLYGRDLEITKITPFYACSDTSYADFIVKMKNNGIGNEHEVTLQVSLNGNIQPSQGSYTLIAEPGETGEISLTVQGLLAGQNNLEVYITDVDGLGIDEVPFNNQKVLNFDINPGKASINVSITPDDKPGETTWAILNSQGVVLASGGPFDQPFGYYVVNSCLDRDSCYSFRLHDSGSDGMPGGIVYVTYQGSNLVEYFGENFGSEISIPFCAVNACSSLQISLGIYAPTASGGNDGVIVATATGGTPPYFFSLNNIIFQDSARFENLLPGFYTVTCIDADSCLVQSSILLQTSSSEEPFSASGITVSPNPTTGIAHIQVNSTENAASVRFEVFDQFGKMIQTGRMSKWSNEWHGNIALDNFPAGIYQVRVSGLKRLYIGRVVKNG
jgi:hypothetical protein